MNLKLSKGLIILISVTVALGLTVLSIYGYINSTRNSAIEYQGGVKARYSDAQNELSSMTSKIVEQARVATEKKGALKEVVKAAMEGRYGDKGFGQGSALFVAMHESDLGLGNNLQIYDDLSRSISAGREAYKNKQSSVIDYATVAKIWFRQGLIRSSLVRSMGYPDDTLTAMQGTTKLTGWAALEYISTPIINEATTQAYTTGKMEPIDPFKK